MALELSFAAPAELQDSDRCRSREAVLELLSTRWPLGVLAIHAALRNEFGLKVSYQAVHKTVASLWRRQVLVRDGRLYAINLVWVEKVEARLKGLKANYKKGFRTVASASIPAAGL